MNRSWVRFPQAAQIRPPGSGWAFLYACLLLVPRWCSGRRRARLWGRAALCARGRRPAREPSAPRASLGASPRSPPVPSGPSGALHTSGAWSLMHGSVRRLEAWPGPAAAHGHRSQALRSLRSLRTSGAGLLMCGSTRRLEAWPGPAAAARPSGPPMWSGLSYWDFGALRCVLLQTSSIEGVFRVDF